MASAYSDFLRTRKNIEAGIEFFECLEVLLRRRSSIGGRSHDRLSPRAVGVRVA